MKISKEQPVLEPLANRLRPLTLDQYVGQKHLVGKGKVLWQFIQNDQIPSMIFWGPPGVGKTTLAKIIAQTTKAHFIDFSAVNSGIREIKKVMQDAMETHLQGIKTIVFIDEIHRFNKAPVSYTHLDVYKRQNIHNLTMNICIIS